MVIFLCNVLTQALQAVFAVPAYPAHLGCKTSTILLSGAFEGRLNSHMKPPTSMGCELTCVIPFRLTVL